MTTAWQPFLERFLAVARARPDAPALVERGKRVVSYGELCRRAAGLAGWLTGRGVGREAIVAIALPRGVGLVVAELACWWAGAAFLPLDPNLPAARREFILGDAGVSTVIDADLGLEAEPASPHRARADELAYVIYTSGSTGQPRGVAVEHRGIVGLLDAQVEAFGLGAGARSLWMLSPVFDASISDVGTALLSGATLYLEAEDDLRSLDRLTAILHERQITHVDLPPALLRLLEAERMPASLRTVIIGGEPCPPAVVRKWAGRFRVVNVYGPTEVTVCTSLCVCDAETWTEPLLGRPIAGVRYHVLDGQMRPVATGEAGELCIEGDCLARGYVNRTELTASKFVEHDGRRLYRTADQVRWRRDGEYVFLGRLDRQVKVRGQLVAPEEVEARLLEYPQVRQAAVVKRGEALTAFIVAASPGVTAGEVRGHLARFLPAWMVPSRIEFVDELPRSASGKVDLVRLGEKNPSPPAPLPEAGRGERASPPPRFGEGAGGRGSALLARLCRGLLNVEAVDWQASFFAQGGDSLTLLQLVAAASAEGVVLPPPLLASERSLEEVVRWLEEHEGSQTPPGAMSCAELRRDAQGVLAGLQPSSGRGPRVEEPRCIFLTGATGFLGSYLLFELLRRTRAEVICLVRAAGMDEGKRLEHVADDRVRVVVGDLTRERFGLDAASWQELTDRVDAVYHSAARVHLVEPYESLRADNLLGTAEVLRLAGSGRAKRIHHVSTLSVFVATDQDSGVLLESDDLSQTRWAHGGYAQSKWAAEWLVRRAAESLGPTAIYRPGLITGDSRTGIAARNDFLSLFIRGLVELGCLPPIAGDLRLDVTPVDHAARAIAHLSLHTSGETPLETYHIAGSGSLSLASLVTALARRGISLAPVDAAAFSHRLARLHRAAPAAACLALCRGLPLADGFTRYRTLDLFQATGVAFAMRNTQAGLEGSGIRCPPPDDRLLDLYLDHALQQP